MITGNAHAHHLEQQSRVSENRRLVLRGLHRARAPLLAGTDAGIGIVPPGSSLATELHNFVSAGIPTHDALRAATIDAARFLGIDHELGSIAAGMRADLVLLNRNPLDDINAVRAPIGIVLRGRWLPAGTGGGLRP